MTSYTPAASPSNASIPIDQIQSSYEAVLALELPQTSVSKRKQAVEHAAEEEARNNREFPVDERNLTHGMHRHCVLGPEIDALTAFRQTYSRFVTALRPQQEHIDALDELDREIARLEQLKESAHADAVRDERDQNSKYDFACKTQEEATRLFESEHIAAGKPPVKLVNPFLYLFMLIAVGVAEWFINYEAFFSFLDIPALAAATTLVAGGVVAYCSHLHGTWIRQFDYQLGKYVEPSARARHWAWFGFWSAMFVLVLIYVGYARYVFVLASSPSGPVALQGIASAGPSIIQSVSVSLISNILVYVLGAAIAFMVHDPNASLVERHKVRKRTDKRHYALHKPVEAKIKYRKDKIDKDIAEKRHQAEHDYGQARDLRKMRDQAQHHFNEMANEAAALISQSLRWYKAALLDALAAEGGEQLFQRGEDSYTRQQYMGMECAVDADEVLEIIGLSYNRGDSA